MDNPTLAGSVRKELNDVVLRTDELQVLYEPILEKSAAQSIADDQLDNDISASGTDELAQLLSALSVMQDKLRTRIRDERQLSVTNGRMKQALECVSCPVRVMEVSLVTRR